MENYPFPEERIFELPNEINENNVHQIMDNIGFFGVNDDELMYHIFEFMIDHEELSVELMNTFTDFRKLLNDVIFILKIKEKQLICVLSAKIGKINCLRYAHEHGCPWDAATCKYAFDYGHPDCLQYAINNKCPGYENYI